MKLRTSLVRPSWFLVLAAVLLLLAGCDIAQPGFQASSNTSNNGIHIHGDAQTIDWTVTANMCIGSLVADAGIAELGASHWNTPDGKRAAALDTNTILKKGYAIYKPVHFSFMHIHRDQRKQPTSEFDTIGGAVGEDTYDMGYPQVTSGGSYLVVLVAGIDPVAGAYTEKSLVMAAAFPIFNGMVVLKPKMVDRDGQVSQQQEDAPLSQIVQQLASCK